MLQVPGETGVRVTVTCQCCGDAWIVLDADEPCPACGERMRPRMVDCPHCGSRWTVELLDAHVRTCAWQTKYQITSARSGRVWTRQMVYNACTRQCGPGHGPEIRALLDDPSFMRPRAGVIPARIVEAIWIRVLIG